MKKTTKKYVIGILILLAIAAVIGGLIWRNTRPSPLDSFAQCLKDKGATFYGAFWCPHCRNQKEMFGTSVRYLPYVECSTPDGNSQLPICQEKKIEGYPTWIFADGSRQSGEIPLDELAKKTGCTLP